MKFHIIIDHPWSGSFNYAIMHSFIEGIEENRNDFDVLDLNKEDFDPIMSEEELAGYSQGVVFDPNIREYQERLIRSDYLVMIFPIWWMIMPVRLKGWMDKVLLPGFAFTIDQEPKPLLNHISGATILTTTGVPDDFHRKEFNNALEWVLCKGTLNFVGIKEIRWLNFGDTGYTTQAKHNEWLEFVKEYGRKFT